MLLGKQSKYIVLIDHYQLLFFSGGILGSIRDRKTFGSGENSQDVIVSDELETKTDFFLDISAVLIVPMIKLFIPYGLTRQDIKKK